MIPVLMYILRVCLAALLMIGSFMGFPTDATLSGFFWGATLLVLLLPIFEDIP